jgi:hypothetical protein
MMALLQRSFTRKVLMIPPWSQKMYRDPFDYPLRSLEEVKAEFERFPIDKSARIEIVQFKDRLKNDPKYVDPPNVVVKMWIDMNGWNLTPLQRERLAFLLGPRYKQGESEFKIVSRQYPERQQNIQKCLDIAYELLMECKRAP